MKSSEKNNFSLEKRPGPGKKIALIFTHTGPSFSAHGDDFNNENLSQINNKHKLKVLSLSGTKIDDAGVKYISENFNDLEVLDLDETLLSDRGMAYIGNLSNLRELWIENTHVTDRGLEGLKTLPNIGIVSALGTKLTENGVETFFKAYPDLLPNAEILFDSAYDNALEVKKSVSNGSVLGFLMVIFLIGTISLIFFLIKD
jgi:Leucine-rich repeat (LRR) protein